MRCSANLIHLRCPHAGTDQGHRYRRFKNLQCFNNLRGSLLVENLHVCLVTHFSLLRSKGTSCYAFKSGNQAL